MLTILGAVLSAVVKGLMAFFLPSKDEKLGKLEATGAAQVEVIKDEQTAKTIGDRVDTMSDTDAKQLQLDLNNRP